MSLENVSNIFLIGPMGAGKSSVGVRLAKLFHMPFFDTDREVEERSGVDIDWIFEIEGEKGFQEREKLVLEEFSQKQGIVLATGGSIVWSEYNRQLIQESGVVVYLQVPLAEQVQRVQRFPERRPNIDASDPVKSLVAINQSLEKWHEALADFSYQNNASAPGRLAKRIFGQIKQYILDS